MIPLSISFKMYHYLAESPSKYQNVYKCGDGAVHLKILLLTFLLTVTAQMGLLCIF